MKPIDVLSLHDLLMAKYDKLLPIGLTIKPESSLEEKKEGIKNLLTEGVPAAVFGDSNIKFLVPSDGDKITKAASAAYGVAINQMQDSSDLEKYKESLREAFDAALRVELYREFLARGQSYEELKLKFIQEKPGENATVASLMNYLFEDINKNINSQFNVFEKSGLSAEDQKQVASMKQELNKFSDTFKSAITDSLQSALGSQAKINSCQKAALDFQIAAGKLIRSYQVKNKSNLSWAPFLKNMLLLITGIGAIPAIRSLISKAVTGKYAFFDKSFLRETPDKEMAPEDRLLSKPKK